MFPIGLYCRRVGVIFKALTVCRCASQSVPCFLGGFFLPALLLRFQFDLFCEGDVCLFAFFNLEPLFFSVACPGLSGFRWFFGPELLTGTPFGRVLCWFIACLWFDLFFFDAPGSSWFGDRPLCVMFF